MKDGFKIVNLDFDFKYFDKIYNEITISTMGYVCLGRNTACDQDIRPMPYDILVGLNYGLDTSRNGSGQIYYKNLLINSDEFTLAQIYVNLLNSEFLPKSGFMVTYDQVSSYDKSSGSKVSFQVFLLADSSKSYIAYKFNSCPADLTLKASIGLNQKQGTGILKEVTIDNGQQCSNSNVGQTGVWVSEVTSFSSG
jgi:hypothetical protein